MRFRRYASEHWLLNTLVVSLPSVLVLGLLTYFGQISGGAAFLGMIVVIVITGAGLRPVMKDIDRLIEHANSVSEKDADFDPPEFHYSEAARALASAVVRLKRLWLERGMAAEAEAAVKNAVLNALPDPLLLLDADLRVTGANPAAERLFDRNLTDQDLPMILRDPAVLDYASVVQRTRETRHGQITLTTGQVEHVYNVTILPLGVKTRDGTDLIVVFNDLTSALRAEQMRSDFVANASHELRTPLSNLMGFIETLMGVGKDDPDAVDNFLPIMQRHAQRMSSLISDLLSLSRIEVNEHHAPSETIAVPALINGVRELLAPQAQDKSITVVTDIEPDLPAITADSSELSQVVHNLLSNAIKYSPKKSEVKVTVSRATRLPGSMPGLKPQDCLCIAVADQGEGIPREHIPRLTERFYRVDTARSREMGGTGLGLAIVKHVLNRHRGALEIHSEEGKGSVFRVYLPITPPGSR